MTLGLVFWILMLLWLVLWLAWSPHPMAPNVVMFLLLLCLGWHAFGVPIHG